MFSSDSIEDLEFVGDDSEEEPRRRPQLHIVAPWIDADGDCSHIQAWGIYLNNICLYVFIYV